MIGAVRVMRRQPFLEQRRDLERQASEVTSFARAVTLTIVFETVEDRDVAKEMLRDAAATAGKKPGRILLEALKTRGIAAKKKKTG